MATNPFINILHYKNASSTSPNETTTGVVTLSADGGDSPLTVVVNSSRQEPQVLLCGIQCVGASNVDGETKGPYKTAENSKTVISFVCSASDAETRAKKLALWRILSYEGSWVEADSSRWHSTVDSPTDSLEIDHSASGSYNAVITHEAPRLFFIRVGTLANESPIVDKTVSIVTSATIAQNDA